MVIISSISCNQFSNRSFFHRGNVRNIVEPQKKKIVNKTQSEAPILWSSFATFAFLTGEVCKMQMRTWQFAAHQENLFWKSYKLGPVDNSVVTSPAIEALWCFWWWYFYACKANKDILFNISSILLIYLLDWGRCHLVGYLVWEVHQHKPGNSCGIKQRIVVKLPSSIE